MSNVFDKRKIEYSRRRPEKTVLYKVVQNNYQNYFQQKSAMGIEYPKFIHDTFRKFLKCGILENGFIRCHCKTCKHDFLVGFSCKCRGFCNSCHGRRQAESAIHLDNIFPNYPIRQWVLSLPYEIRYIVANNPKFLSKTLNVYIRTIQSWYRKKARRMGYRDVVTGSVCFIHRFNSALTLSPHFHSLFLDGVYYKKHGEYFFMSIGSPKKEDLESIVKRIFKGVRKVLLKLDPQNVNFDFQNPTKNGIGHFKILENYIPVLDSDYVEDRDPYSFKFKGFSLNAKVVILKDKSEKLKKLIGYVARGPISQEKLKEVPGGVSYELKNMWSNGATHVLFSNESFIQRLVALIPPAKSNQTRFHGIFAPNFKDRLKILPSPKKEKAAQKDSNKVLWADLIKHSFGIDILICKKCSGRMTPIAVIKDKKVAIKILDHMNLRTVYPIKKTGTDPPKHKDVSEIYESTDQRPTDW